MTMPLNAKTLADALREILERSVSPRTGSAPMSQSDLGRLLGVNPSNVSRWVRPERPQVPSEEHLDLLAQQFPSLVTRQQLARLRAEVSREPEDADASQVDAPAEEAPAAGPSPNERARRRRPRDKAPALREAPARQVPVPEAVRPPRESPEPVRAAETPPAAVPRRERPSGALLPGGFQATPPVAAAPAPARAPAPPAVAPPAPAPAEPPVQVLPTTARAPEPTSLLAWLAPVLRLHEQALSGAAPSSDPHSIPAHTRFTMAATLAVGELERVSGDLATQGDTYTAATSLVSDLWRLTRVSTGEAGPEVGPIRMERDEQRLREATIAVAQDRAEAFRRLTDSLAGILFPSGASGDWGQQLRLVLLRSLTVSPRR
jgi:transcriptional regulator with XRE-family HTH domain